MVDAIAAALTRCGGEIHLGTEITQILVKDRRVTGIELGGEQRQQDGQNDVAPPALVVREVRVVEEQGWPEP